MRWPERVTSTLREALAKGADRAIHIEADDLGDRDTLGIARMLAGAVKGESPDLILTGYNQTTWDWGRPAWCWRSCWGFRTRH